MACFYQAADVVVCRAGANTVAELAVVGVPSILVPLPGAPGDHQTRQRRRCWPPGRRVVVADAECSRSRLAREIDALRCPGRAGSEPCGRRPAALGRPDAVAAVVAVVEAHARTGPGRWIARRPGPGPGTGRRR